MDADPFDVYFEKAAVIEAVSRLQDELAVGRRGSLPSEVNRLLIEEDCLHHHRTASCKSSKPRANKSSTRSSPRRDSSTGLDSLAVPSSQVKVSSAPQSRSASFRKMRRPKSVKDFQEIYCCSDPSTSVNFEQNIGAKLEELKRLESEDCCVVRSFTTSPDGLVNRGDSVRRKTKPEIQPLTSIDITPPPPNMNKTSCRSVGRCSSQVPSKVAVLGDREVGKTALLHQFMTSEYMAALHTTFELEESKTVSVLVNNIETMLDVVDVDKSIQMALLSKPDNDIDCYLLLYSITDRQSFDYSVHLLSCLAKPASPRSYAVILVANKSDLVRKRQVTETEAKDVCTEYDCKYIEVSAVLNHRIDDLLVGLATQVQLNSQRRSNRDQGIHTPQPLETASFSIWAGPRALFKRFFSRQTQAKRPCEDLTTL